LTALLHGTPVVGVSQNLRRWTEGATYTRQGDHHVGHWPTFLVSNVLTNCGFVLVGLKNNNTDNNITCIFIPPK